MGKDLKALKDKWAKTRRSEPYKVGLLFEKKLYLDFQKLCSPMPVNRVMEEWMRDALEEAKGKK